MKLDVCMLGMCMEERKKGRNDMRQERQKDRRRGCEGQMHLGCEECDRREGGEKHPWSSLVEV